ncbi:hypothetical protein V1517DRAFT_327323 [Lipomyces orientalis]|uniref:Uncharacterized protein n=1 Tax=Lipomyces orientalis TaxID=1233043 RepID=A0ACC3TIX1_9ASCO
MDLCIRLPGGVISNAWCISFSLLSIILFFKNRPFVFVLYLLDGLIDSSSFITVLYKFGRLTRCLLVLHQLFITDIS